MKPKGDDPKNKSQTDNINDDNLKHFNETVNNLQEAMLSMKDTFDKAMETNSNIQIKTQTDIK